MNLAKSFFLGLLAAGGALIVELILYVLFTSQNPDFSPTSTFIFVSIIVAVLIEEFFKFILLRKTIQAPSAIDARVLTPPKIFLAALVFGLGFSVIEAVLNFFSLPAGTSFLSVEFFGVILLHTTTAGLIGYLLIQTQPQRLLQPFIVIAAAFTVHLTYNLLVAYSFIPSLFLAYLAALLMLLGGLYWHLLIHRKNLPKAQA